MKDTLSLSEEQKQQVYDVNIQLHEQKMQVRREYGNMDSVSIHIQKVENTRDSLYRAFLTTDQYRAYRYKKRFLVSNN